MEKKAQKIKKRYNRIANIYDFVEKPMEHALDPWRRTLIKQVDGKVLEVGVGTGHNLKYYPQHLEVTAIDFSPNMIEIAKRKASELGLGKKMMFHVMDVQHLEFPDSCFDTVLTSCVFCSVPDPIQGLREIRRVCKPEGKIVMLEHVRSYQFILGGLMDVLNPIPVHLYGANINRETVDNIKQAGFTHIEVQNLWFDIVKLITIKNSK